MADAENEKVQERLRRIQPTTPRSAWWRRLVVSAGILATGAAGGAWVATVPPSDTNAPAPMETSKAGEFLGPAGLDGFTTTESEPVPIAVRTEVQTVTAPKAQAGAARRELAKAKANLEAAHRKLAAAQASPGVDPTQLAALREELQQMRDETALRDQAFDELDRDNMRLQPELEAATKLADQSQTDAAMEAQRLAELEQRRAELEARRAEEKATLEARTRSASVAYRAAGGVAAVGAEGAAELAETLETSAISTRDGRSGWTWDSRNDVACRSPAESSDRQKGRDWASRESGRQKE